MYINQSKLLIQLSWVSGAGSFLQAFKASNFCWASWSNDGGELQYLKLHGIWVNHITWKCVGTTQNSESFIRFWISSRLNFWSGIPATATAAPAPLAKLWHDQARLTRVSWDMTANKLGLAGLHWNLQNKMACWSTGTFRAKELTQFDFVGWEKSYKTLQKCEGKAASPFHFLKISAGSGPTQLELL